MTEQPPNRRCPECQANGHDTGSDAGHLFLSEKGDNWICNKIDYHKDKAYYIVKHDPLTNAPVGSAEPDNQEEEETFGNAEEFSAGSTFVETVREKPADFRGMPAEQYEKYGCSMTFDEGEIYKVFYPVKTSKGNEVLKVRTVLPEKDFAMSRPLDPDEYCHMIGAHLLRNQKELLIVEGQDDAIASDFMLNDGRPIGMQVLCVSVPNGANLKVFKDNYDFITDKQWNRVTFCPDGDEAGQKVVESVASLFPTIRVMSISEKDACDMLHEGKQSEFQTKYTKADKYMPPCIVDISTILPSLDEFVPMGLDYPWDNMTNNTYGMVPHQIVSVGSGPGAGKSSVVRAIQQHLMFRHELPIGNFALEDNTETALRYLIGYMINQRIHIPGSEYDKDEVKRVGLSLVDKAFFFDNRYFKGEFNKIISTIRLLYANGVCHFFIDPVSALAAHLSSSDANTFINAIMIDLSRLVQELPIYIMLVNHLNNPTSGKSHDEGGRVLPSQFTGSKGQWRYSTDMWGFERDILNEDPYVKNTMIVRNLKHRADGNKTGQTFELHYNVDTGRQEEEGSNYAPVPPPKVAPSSDPKPNNNFKPEPTEANGSLSDLMGG